MQEKQDQKGGFVKVSFFFSLNHMSGNKTTKIQKIHFHILFSVFPATPLDQK